MSEQRNIHTLGIILKKHPVGENDMLVTLHSPELGKIQASARGARKITSSFGGHLESLNLCRFQLYKSPSRYTITQCQIAENFKNIRQDYERMVVAGLMAEIFHKSTHGGEHSQELFNLLRESLHKLCDSDHHFFTVESFKLNLLRNMGALPNLENCASCHTRWRDNHEILLETGGHLRCRDCHQTTGRGAHLLGPDSSAPDGKHLSSMHSHAPIDFGIIKLIRYLTLPSNEQNKNISCTLQQKKQLKHITRLFLEHFLDREIMTERLLPELR